MAKFASKNQAIAEEVEQRRKSFLPGLVAVNFVGFFVGYLTSSFFGKALVSDPNHPGYALGTWATTREIILVALTFFGILIWPAIFSVVYYFWRRWRDANFERKTAAYDEEARQVRVAATEARIVEARQRGEIK